MPDIGIIDTTIFYNLMIVADIMIHNNIYILYFNFIWKLSDI